ncbi:MAG: hypothetical protein HGA78_09220 [Nitrospirales bacterium]|nr:hypothetical protein [Nitrospirales bacterium]
MKFLRYIFRNITVLNLILALVLAFFAAYALSPLMNISVAYKAPAVKKKDQSVAAQAVEEPKPVSISDYMGMAEENLFHPDRVIPVEKKAELPKPEFVLYGTLITGTVNIAYMEDKKAPVTSPGRGKRQIALKKGESLSGFMLKEVEKTRVVMARGEETVVVALDVQKSREPVVIVAPAPTAPTPSPASAPPGAVFPIPGVKFKQQ